jgi:receptor kinase-like protein
VLETITGKRPTDGEFTQGLSLHGYVEHGINGGRVLDVVDTQLSLGLDDNNRQTANDFFYLKTKIDCLVSLLKLGAFCSHEIPSNRMSTGDIIKELRYIRESLTHVREHSAL